MISDPRLCEHPDNYVTADICEGDASWPSGKHYQIAWCRICGAYCKANDWVLPLERLPTESICPHSSGQIRCDCLDDPECEDCGGYGYIDCECDEHKIEL